MACKIAQDAAADVAHKVGFDPITILTIITTLIGIFKSCMQPPSPAAAKQHVLDAYRGGRYDKGTLRVAKVQAKRAGRKAKNHLSDDQATEVAVATLDRIRLASPEDLKEAFDSTPTVSDDEAA